MSNRSGAILSKVSAVRPWLARDAAEYLSVTPWTVRQWAIAGILKGKQVGRSWLFDPADVQRHAGMAPKAE